MSSPSEQLTGLEINGWKVLEQLGTYPGMSGGNFSTGYFVEKNGKVFSSAKGIYRICP